MKKKFNFKKKTFNFRKNVFILIIIALFISIYLLISFIGKKIYPMLLNYGEMEIKKITTLIINKAVSKQLSTNMNIDDLFKTNKSEDGTINSVDFNPVIVNKVLNITTSLIQLNLKKVEEGNADLIELGDDILSEYNQEKLKKGIIYEVPLGAISNNIMLSNLGPKIPIKFKLVGAVESNINSKITNYGINAALIEVSIKISVTTQALLPLVSKQIVIENEIPIAVKLVHGTVPKYYSNGLSTNSPIISLPIE